MLLTGQVQCLAECYGLLAQAATNGVFALLLAVVPAIAASRFCVVLEDVDAVIPAVSVGAGYERKAQGMKVTCYRPQRVVRLGGEGLVAVSTDHFPCRALDQIVTVVSRIRIIGVVRVVMHPVMAAHWVPAHRPTELVNAEFRKIDRRLDHRAIGLDRSEGE